LPDLSAELLDRCRHLALLILDVDGILTDGRLYYGADGEALKAFHVRDGAAIKMLQSAGVAVALITWRQSSMVQHRAAELGIQHVYQGAADKTGALGSLLLQLGLAADQAAHMGDDLPDLALFNRVGVRFTVPDANPEIRARADYCTTLPGGHGAVAEVCQLILQAQDRWQPTVARFDY
jgi:3-deoxy-D-manno-octulosonate 8-phosphate phosphatase (KDO 8-P phosphatase)